MEIAINVLFRAGVILTLAFACDCFNIPWHWRALMLHQADHSPINNALSWSKPELVAYLRSLGVRE